MATATVPITVSKAPAVVTLSNLSTTYNGSAQSASAITVPAGLAVSISYNGSTTAPSAAGSYAVLATVMDPNYSGSVSGTMVITGGSADGSAVGGALSTNPSGGSGGGGGGCGLGSGMGIILMLALFAKRRR